MLQFLRSADRHISEWTPQEVADKKEKIQREIVGQLQMRSEPQSARDLSYQAYMNFRDSDFKYDEQHNFVVESLNNLIQNGRVRVIFVKLEHPGGISSLVPLPYIQLMNR